MWSRSVVASTTIEDSCTSPERKCPTTGHDAPWMRISSPTSMPRIRFASRSPTIASRLPGAKARPATIANSRRTFARSPVPRTGTRVRSPVTESSGVAQPKTSPVPMPLPCAFRATSGASKSANIVSSAILLWPSQIEPWEKNRTRSGVPVAANARDSASESAPKPMNVATPISSAATMFNEGHGRATSAAQSHSPSLVPLAMRRLDRASARGRRVAAPTAP